MSTTSGGFIRDVRALGAAAPVRAAYEFSKRSGFHTVLFKAGRGSVHSSSPDLRLTALPPVDQEARTRCLDDAEQIVKVGVRVFGRRVKTGIHGPWSLDPLTGQTWPERDPWWKIDIRSEARMSDVKHVWEAGRHRDMVVLARASVLEPDEGWIDTLTAALRSWCKECPPETGVHWYSSLELALRAIAWSQVLTLVRDRLPADLIREMDRQLLASGHHLTVELPYTISSMRNNHMLGDALGFLVLARLFPHLPRSRRWKAIGDRLFNSQLARHMRADGSMIEDSLSYHRFVLEMLVIRVLVGDAPPSVRTALRSASEHLRRLGVFDGDVPQYGDWDEGRVLTSSGHALDVAGSAALGIALTGGLAPDEWHVQFDEVAWYARRSIDSRAKASSPNPGTSTTGGPASVDVVGGIVRAHRGPWEVWFKVTGGPSHGHADLTSVWMMYEGHWVIADPGTGTYNGPLEVRNGLRASVGHPVIRPFGEDQLVPHRAFRWLRDANGHVGPPVLLGEQTILFGWHDAYVSSSTPVRVSRTLVITQGSVVVIDGIDQPIRGYELTLPLHPDVQVSDNILITSRARLPIFGLEDLHAIRGRERPFAGWHSPSYGDWIPSTWLSSRFATPAPATTWGIGIGTVSTGPDGRRVTVDGLSLEVHWSRTGAKLTVTETGSGRRYDSESPG